jgi:hypothetical protein
MDEHKQQHGAVTLPAGLSWPVGISRFPQARPGHDATHAHPDRQAKQFEEGRALCDAIEQPTGEGADTHEDTVEEQDNDNL